MLTEYMPACCWSSQDRSAVTVMDLRTHGALLMRPWDLPIASFSLVGLWGRPDVRLSGQISKQTPGASETQDAPGAHIPPMSTPKPFHSN